MDILTLSEIKGARADLAKIPQAISRNLNNCLSFSYPIFESRTFAIPFDGIAIFRVLGAGGSGGKSQFGASGGGAGAWCGAVVPVKKMDAVWITIGSGGISQSTNLAKGNDGGNSTLSWSNGPMLTAGGGHGGGFAATSGATPGSYEAPKCPERPLYGLPADQAFFGWDGVQQTSAANFFSGGAGVAIFPYWNNITAAYPGPAVGGIAFSGGGGTGFKGPTTGYGGGASLNGGDFSGRLPISTADGFVCDGSQGEWGISFFGGGGGYLQKPGGNGGGGGGYNGASALTAGSGGYGGGGGGCAGTLNGANGGNGGLGAGGGACGSGVSSKSGAGGNGYANIQLFLIA